MPEYLHPGVYVEEIERGPKPIEGVSTSTAAFVGETERGPVTPTLVTSWAEYVRTFGGVIGPDRFLPFAVRGFFENGGQRAFVCRIVGAGATRAEAQLGGFVVRAVGAGRFGARVYAKIEERRDPDGAPSPVRHRLRLAYYAEPPALDPDAWFEDPSHASQPTHAESFDDLVTDAGSRDFYETRVNGSSKLVTLHRADGASSGAMRSNGSAVQLRGGSDGAVPVDVADYQGKVDGRPEIQGLAALELDRCREVSLVCAPGASFAVAKAVVAHCEQVRHRFAVIDCARTTDTSNFHPRETVADSKDAAFYYPWIVVSDPTTGVDLAVPPGGHVLGIFARVDAERGVWKAPANELVRGALRLDVETDDQTQDVLNPRGINVIRRFEGRGILLFGARTLSSNSEWRYVGVRRLFHFLERSIYQGTQWVVFEPNDEPLWARMADAIRSFLRAQWRAGALHGRVEQEACSVQCDRSTMTQDDIAHGRLVCEILVAPVRPAEFVVFRVVQHTAEAQH